MGTLRVIGLTKTFGITTIFHDVSFQLNRGEKAGLVGANGVGKTTLLKCLLGLEAADSGQVSLPTNHTIGYVEQDLVMEGRLYDVLCEAYQDILECGKRMRELEQMVAAEQEEEQRQILMARYAAYTERFERGGGYEVDAAVRKVAYGLGFTPEDLERTISEFSGGQKTRICLARALIRQPDFLFLDEPTNHLDIPMVEWLEQFLLSYSGGVLVISHDRYFLDHVVGKVLDLEQERVTVYQGNYTRYAQQKAKQLEARQRAYEKQQAEIEATEEYIRRYKAGIKSKQARGRQSQLERLERIEKPVETKTLTFNFPPAAECGERIIDFEAASFGYNSELVFKDLSFSLRRGEKAAVVGPNGAGKSTILKLIVNQLEPSSGKVKIGSRVQIGYFAQEHEDLNPANRVLDELMLEFGLGEEKARSYLGRFLFSGDSVFKTVDSLSGGEKARLALLKLFLRGANFLILDEPTNHLDIPAKEAVEWAINEFTGTCLIVSHDRYLLSKTADRILELSDGKLTDYRGGYQFYRDKKALEEKALEIEQAKVKQVKPVETEKPVVREAKPQNVSRSVRRADPKRAEKLEQDITGLEYLVKYLEQQLNSPEVQTDASELERLLAEHAKTKAELAAKYDRWLEFSGEG